MIRKEKGTELTKEVMNLLRRYEIFYAAVNFVDSEGDILSLKIAKETGKLEKVGKVGDISEAAKIVKLEGIVGVN